MNYPQGAIISFHKLNKGVRMPPDISDEERLEELPEDNGTPFQPASPSRDDTGSMGDISDDQQADDNKLDDTHPITDSGSDIDSQELYDEGLPGAVEAHEPNAGNDVIGYTPPDQPTPNPS
jgi:hypothetical protein